VEFAGCLDLHLAGSCSVPSAGRGCGCLNTPGRTTTSHGLLSARITC
jgi:hypothetical protein